MFRAGLWLLILALGSLAAPGMAAEMDFQITSDRGDTYRAAITIDNRDDRKITDWSLEFTLDRDVVQTFGAQMTRIAADRYRFTPSEWTKEIAPGGQAKFTFVGKPGNLKTGPQQVKLDVSYTPSPTSPTVATPAPPPPPVASADVQPKPPAPAPKPAAPAPKPAWKQTSPDNAVSVGKPTTGGGIPHVVAFKLKGAWNNGFTAEIAVVNNTDRMIRPWRLEFEFDNKIEEMWEAQYKRVGDGRYVVTPRDYNQELPPGGFIVFGFKGADAFHGRPSDTKLGEGG